MRTQIKPCDILSIDSVLEIVCRFQLSIQHGVFLKTHEGCIRIRFGIAVSVAADMQVLRVFLQPADIGFQCFYRFLQLAFPMTDAINKSDYFLLPGCDKASCAAA